MVDNKTFILSDEKFKGPNAFLFYDISYNEVLRISPDGFFIKGEKVSDNIKVYNAFVQWLSSGVGYDVEKDIVIKREDFKDKLMRFLQEGLELRINTETIGPKIDKFLKIL